MNNPEDLRGSNGEVVRRVDLERAAGTSGEFTQGDHRVAGYEGVELAGRALAGDQAALDKFHTLAGLALSGVTEHVWAEGVRLTFRDALRRGDGVGDADRAVFLVTDKAGESCALIGAVGLVKWIFSPEGQASLKLRGVDVPVRTDGSAVAPMDRMRAATDALAAVATALGLEERPTLWIENTRDAIIAEIRRREVAQS
jgi:hypothetical protein